MQIVRIGEGAADHVSAETVGAKAANLARMAALGLPVPPAFVLPIELCATILAGAADAERELADSLKQGVDFLEQACGGRRFGDRRRPLLVSVRSGAARSMPGMLDTVLDVGCTSAAVRGLLRMTGNPRFAWDCRQRLLEGYAAIVLGTDPALFAARRRDMVVDEGVDSDRELDGEALERLALAYRTLLGDGLPDDPMEQLASAARAVYRSWTSERAETYRPLEHLEYLQGTAVTVQAMVFGNCSRASGAGVAFSRDPSTGAARPVIDVLFDAQGEDVVSGLHNPETDEALARALPTAAAELRDILVRLEREFGDVQDVEFTIENGRLYILQTRAAKRTPRAALRIAIDLVHEGLITHAEALRRLNGRQLDRLARVRLSDTADPMTQGVGASSGIAVGRAAFDIASAQRLAACGDPVILVRPDTSTADVAGFAISAGIVTAVGGRTAHAALVARQLGKPCVVGCDRIKIDAQGRRALVANDALDEGGWISIDGDSGTIYRGQRNVVTERPEAELAEVERWRAADTQLQLGAAAASA